MTGDLIGHNGGPTFDDIVRDNKDRGLLLTMKEVIVEAVRDPRLDRRHLRVLAEVIAAINTTSGTSYPGHKAISNSLRRYNVSGAADLGYSDQGIRNTLSDLVSFGYLVSTRRAAEKGGRALAHYTIRKPSVEDLQSQITEWIMAQRLAPPRQHPAVGARLASADVTTKPDVNAPCDVTSPPDVTQGHDVMSADDIKPRFGVSACQTAANDPSDVTSSPDVTSRPDVTSDVTSPVPTVTRRKELERSERGASARETSPPAVPPLPPVPVYPPGNGGEEHRGHGVYLNGETIRHPAFAISLGGIRMGTINSGLSASEVAERCLAHALQWAVEIENGQRPEKVLPTKIANFLSRSIMGEVNQQRTQVVRETRELRPFGSRAQTAEGKIETRAERLARMAAEIESKGSRT